MDSLSELHESLPGLVLYMPEKLVFEPVKGDREKYRAIYLELVHMHKIDLSRLLEIKSGLSLENVEFTQHKSEINNIQDWWFGTRRADGDTYLIVLYGLVCAYIHAITDLNKQSHNLDKSKLEIIHTGLSRTAAVYFEFLYNEELPGSLNSDDTFKRDKKAPLKRPERILHPMCRWRSGHQLFFNTIQTLNILFKMTREACAQKDWKNANRHLENSAFFMKLSSVSIEYASNFEWEQYHTQVRSIMPPGFSGLMLADHTLMINMLKELRKDVFSNPPVQIQDGVKKYLSAMEDCYDAHNLICEAFVGNGPSLKGMQETKADPLPAIKSLDNLKKKRIKMLGKKIP